MNALRTITRASNWTPDRLRVLSALVVTEDRVSDEPLGRVEGVVLDDRGEVQSFIVRLWEHGRAAHAVLVPLSVVRWYTESHAPAIGISWTSEMLRCQPEVGRGSARPRPSLSIPSPNAAAAAARAPAPALSAVLLGATTGATVGALLQGGVLAAILGVLAALVAAVLGVGARPAAPPVLERPLPLESPREPWIAHLEHNLANPSTYERRVLHASLLRFPPPQMGASATQH